MRVTQLGSAAAMAAAIQSASQRMQNASVDLSSGRRIRTISDSPTDTATVLRYNANLASQASYQTNAADAQSWLQAGDTALQSASSTVISALSTLESGINGALDQTARNALADQLDADRAQMLDLANSKQQNRSLFGGFGDAAVTDSAAGATFTGDGGQVLRQIGASQTVAVNADGAAAFGFTAGDDVFKVLSDASAALRSGDTAAASTAVTRLNARHDNILTALEKVGTTSNQVSAAQASATNITMSLQTAHDNLVDTDMSKAVMESQLASTAYQAALAAASKANQQSLVDFLK